MRGGYGIEAGEAGGTGGAAGAHRAHLWRAAAIRARQGPQDGARAAADGDPCAVEHVGAYGDVHISVFSYSGRTGERQRHPWAYGTRVRGGAQKHGDDGEGGTHGAAARAFVAETRSGQGSTRLRMARWSTRRTSCGGCRSSRRTRLSKRTSNVCCVVEQACLSVCGFDPSLHNFESILYKKDFSCDHGDASRCFASVGDGDFSFTNRIGSEITLVDVLAISTTFLV